MIALDLNFFSQSLGAKKEGICRFHVRGMSFRPTAKPLENQWEGMKRLACKDERVLFRENALRLCSVFEDFPSSTDRPVRIAGIAAGPKGLCSANFRGIIKRCLLMTTDPGDLVLDPTRGSGTTAYVAEQWGRRWITCDTSRVALALATPRLMTATLCVL